MALPEEDADIIASCFPESLWADVRIVTATMPPYVAVGSAGDMRRLSPRLDSQNPADGLVPRKVAIEGEFVNVLSRIYGLEPSNSLIASFSTKQRLICACIYARNADGYVRQRQVEALLGRAEPWVPTPVLQLLGEYVSEIAQMIHTSFDVIPREAYQSYAAANPAFVKRICKQIVSYYVAGYPGFEHPFAGSPSYAVMSQLGLWDRHEAARLLRPRREHDGGTSRPQPRSHLPHPSA